MAQVGVGGQIYGGRPGEEFIPSSQRSRTGGQSHFQGGPSLHQQQKAVNVQRMQQDPLNAMFARDFAGQQLGGQMDMMTMLADMLGGGGGGGGGGGAGGRGGTGLPTPAIGTGTNAPIMSGVYGEAQRRGQEARDQMFNRGTAQGLSPEAALMLGERAAQPFGQQAQQMMPDIWAQQQGFGLEADRIQAMRDQPLWGMFGNMMGNMGGLGGGNPFLSSAMR